MTARKDEEADERRSVGHRAICVQSRTGRATPAAIAERDERFGKPRTFEQTYLGDPLPGQSALDKRNQEACHGTV